MQEEIQENTCAYIAAFCNKIGIMSDYDIQCAIDALNMYENTHVMRSDIYNIRTFCAYTCV